jgi:putative FmdB family regulatory protein
VPTYQYACTQCGHAFEQFQSFSDDALTECPQCHGRLRKLYNAVGVVFKGSGFYRTDSRKPEKTESASKKDSGDSGSSKSETPAAKKPKETATT